MLQLLKQYTRLNRIKMCFCLSSHYYSQYKSLKKFLYLQFDCSSLRSEFTLINSMSSMCDCERRFRSVGRVRRQRENSLSTDEYALQPTAHRVLRIDFAIICQLLCLPIKFAKIFDVLKIFKIFLLKISKFFLNFCNNILIKCC